MDLEIAGRSALLFGASKGMGRACAQRLSQEPAGFRRHAGAGGRPGLSAV